MPRSKQTTPAEQRPSSRDLRVLRQLFAFLRPYRGALAGAALALLVAAAAVLGFGVVLQRVVDQGLSSGSGAALNQALVLFLVVVTVMAAAAVVWTLLYNPNGLINAVMETVTFGNFSPDWLNDTTWALPAVMIVGIWQGVGFQMIILLAALQDVPGQAALGQLVEVLAPPAEGVDTGA